ncbi:LysE family translocator [Solicola gregarius]|uniref:LysE family translocator n=1 Tax=Solicola gregarius TaxID=2908642 RepID=A0AA46YJM8_9ACTN|nr:LysE family translocator [Solicola gregarius]UYM03671.1 LysE family translocator [Solicola gregarius]
MAVDQFLAFGIAAFILIAIPGPSVMFVVGRALAYGRRTALASVVGNAFGMFALAILVALGLGQLVAESITVFTIVKYAGAAYLVWLGIRAIRKRSAVSALTAEHQFAETQSTWRSLREGFLVAVANPKGFIIFASVLPQFVDRSSGHVPLQMLLLGLLAAVVALMSDSVWAVVASGVREWFARSPRRSEAVQAVGGFSMIGLGVSVAVTGRHD